MGVHMQLIGGNGSMYLIVRNKMDQSTFCAHGIASCISVSHLSWMRHCQWNPWHLSHAQHSPHTPPIPVGPVGPLQNGWLDWAWDSLSTNFNVRWKCFQPWLPVLFRRAEQTTIPAKKKLEPPKPWPLGGTMGHRPKTPPIWRLLDLLDLLCYPGVHQRPPFQLGNLRNSGGSSSARRRPRGHRAGRSEPRLSTAQTVHLGCLPGSTSIIIIHHSIMPGPCVPLSSLIYFDWTYISSPRCKLDCDPSWWLVETRGNFPSFEPAPAGWTSHTWTQDLWRPWTTPSQAPKSLDVDKCWYILSN